MACLDCAQVRRLQMTGVLYAQEQGAPTVEQAAQLIQQLLIGKAEMLKECVGLEISSTGCLTALPALIDHYVPDLDRLPQLVLRIARDVEWRSEKACFQSLAQVHKVNACLALHDFLDALSEEHMLSEPISQMYNLQIAVAGNSSQRLHELLPIHTACSVQPCMQCCRC